jgi:hypothetical protein
MRKIRPMSAIGGPFAAVGYLLVGSALFFGLTQFHPLLEECFATRTTHSLAGDGPGWSGSVALDAQLATIHPWPSVLRWLELRGVAHIPTGIFVVLAATVRVLSPMPVRLDSIRLGRAGGRLDDPEVEERGHGPGRRLTGFAVSYSRSADPSRRSAGTRLPRTVRAGHDHGRCLRRAERSRACLNDENRRRGFKSPPPDPCVWIDSRSSHCSSSA